ncbi:MAG: RNA polymerase sigma factor [Clostridiales bacterium]|nr:RNA polymerase sigma factor [Clostridiales bacterium]
MPDSLSRTDKEFSEIYNRHVDTVYRVCFMFLKNEHDTEDAVQDTFIKLMNYKGEFESEEHEKAWLIRTASNHCRDILKHFWRKTVSLEVVGESEDEEDKSFEVDETLEKVLALPDKYKTVIYLYYYEGYKTYEIAEMIGRPDATVRGYLRKGRELLKINLGGDNNEKK